MPEFLTTRGVTAKIEEIILNANQSLILISPYLSFIPDSFILRLQKAINRQVDITLLYRQYSTIHQNEVEKLKSLNGITIFTHPDIHAKAYFNESEAVVTSFNISEASEANNIEFGIYFTRKEQPQMFRRLVEEFDLAVSRSKPMCLD